MANKIFIKVSALTLLAFVVFSIASFDKNQVRGSNLTAGVISTIMDFFGLDDSTISDCSQGDINLQCPTDVTVGCYCSGGVFGSNNKIWQNIVDTQYLTYSEAKNYCSGVGDGWIIPSPDDLFSIYNYDINYVYSDIQPIKPSWFISTSSSFWTSYVNGTKNTFMTINYGLIYHTNNSGIMSPTICVKNLCDDYSDTSSNDLNITNVANINNVDTEGKITNFVLEGVVYNVNIDDINKKIVIGLQENTSTSSIKSYITISDGAKLFTESGSLVSVSENKYLLSGLALKLTVVSEDGETKNVYSVSTAYPPTVSLDVLNSAIYEKQTTKITWTPIGATSCESSGSDMGWKSGSAPSAVDGTHTWTTGPLGIDIANTPKIYTYGIKCSNSIGSTNTMSKTVKVLPDLYTSERGGSRMSIVATEAGLSGFNQYSLLSIGIRKNFENPEAHIVNCPSTNYSICIEDNDDNNGNYVLIGIK